MRTWPLSSPTTIERKVRRCLVTYVRVQCRRPLEGEDTSRPSEETMARARPV